MMNDSHMVILLILVFLQTISSKQAFPLPRVDPVYVSLLISGLTAGIALDKVLSYSMYIIYHKHILPYFACTIIMFSSDNRPTLFLPSIFPIGEDLVACSELDCRSRGTGMRLGHIIALCFWVRRFTLMVPEPSTQEYTWVQPSCQETLTKGWGWLASCEKGG